jgi:GcrA cell cycle regulator
MDWSSERITELTRLWNEGLSTAEIGKALGISKNAVVGKAHRLRLSSRPSPIRRMAMRPYAPRVRAPKPAAPSLPTMVAAIAKPAAERPAPEREPQEPRVLQLSNQRCMWPVGHPGDSDFHFCGERALVGKPYCVSHCSVAYVKAKPKAGEAA